MGTANARTGLDLAMLAYDMVKMFDRCDYPVDAGLDEIQAALPAFLRALGYPIDPATTSPTTPANDEPTPWTELELDSFTNLATELGLPPIDSANIGPDNIAVFTVADLPAVFAWARALERPLISRRGFAMTSYATAGQYEARIISRTPHHRELDDNTEGAFLHTCNAKQPGKPVPFRRAAAGTCARCDELASGAKPRSAPQWIEEFRAARDSGDMVLAAAIKAHFATNGPHQRGACGPTCTALNW